MQTRLGIFCAFLSSVYCLSTVGCGGPPAQPEVGSERSEDAGPRQGPPDPPDHSLPAEEYIKLGVPTHDRPWLGSDMTRAAEALSDIAKDDARKLPRHQSERSGTVFARMISVQNLEIVKNRAYAI